jgi:hypothetical protein
VIILSIYQRYFDNIYSGKKDIEQIDRGEYHLIYHKRQNGFRHISRGPYRVYESVSLFLFLAFFIYSII